MRCFLRSFCTQKDLEEVSQMLTPVFLYQLSNTDKGPLFEKFKNDA